MAGLGLELAILGAAVSKLTIDCGREPGLQKCPAFISETTSEDKDALSENKPPYDKTNKMAFAHSEDSDQPGHPPSLIKVFAVRSVGS